MSAITGAKQADANEYAADTAAEAQGKAGELAYTQWLQNQANQQPWLTAGNRGLNALQIGLGLETPEQASQALMAQNESTFDPDAYLAAYPGLADTIRQWGWTPWQHYQTYGQQAGNPFTYKQGYGPDAVAAAGYGTGSASGLPGYGSLNDKFTIEDFYANQDPSYEWRKKQGIDALAASGAASGNYGSGNMGVALQDYGQNLASTEYQNAYNRWNQQQAQEYNRLASMAGIGQVTAQNLGSEGAQATSNINSYLTNAANALGAGAIGSSNAWASGFGNLANQGVGALGNWMNGKKIDNLISATKGGYGQSYGYTDSTNYANLSGANSWGGAGWGFGASSGNYPFAEEYAAQGG
jgi:hypothetical protein